MVLRLISCSPRRTALLPPSPAGLPTNLTPAPRRQDHTASPYATSVFVQHAYACLTLPASTASHPAFVTIAIRPSDRGETGKVLHLILASGKPKYFCKKGWTRSPDTSSTDLPVVGQIGG